MLLQKKLRLPSRLSLLWIIFPFLFGAALFSCEKDVPMAADEALMVESQASWRCDQWEAPCVTELVAGQNMLAGSVTVSSDGTGLTVAFETEEGWMLYETHLYIGKEPPQKHTPGKFPFKHEGLSGVVEDVYTVSLSSLGVYPGDCLYFAAHAEVKMKIGEEAPSMEEFAAALPDQVTMSVTYPSAGAPSYFVVSISGGTNLDGSYFDWCIDTDNTINQNTSYTAKVYSSYENLEGLVEHPENLDLVNWIINQEIVGETSLGCGGVYTYGDVQRAIWALVEDEQSSSGLGSWSQCRVDEILGLATDNGEGFMPDCGDMIAVILQPVNGEQATIAQITFGEVVIPCTPTYQEETAWGFGPYEFKQGWGWYFKCCIPE